MPVRFESPPGSRLKHTHLKHDLKKGRSKQGPLLTTTKRHVQKSTEYDRSYKWNTSFLMKGFDPSPEQASSPAGKASVLLANVSDPPLQRKKKPVEKPLTVTTSFDAKDTASDDYILLGDQSKFAPNIKYTVHGRSKENVTPNVQPTKTVEMAAVLKGDHSHGNSAQKLKKTSVSKKKAPSWKELPIGKDETNLKKAPKAENLKTSAGLTKDVSTSTSEEIISKSPESSGRQNGAVANGGPPTAERTPPPAPRPKDDRPVKAWLDMPRPTKPSMKRPPPAPKKSLEVKKKITKEPVEAEREAPTRRPADPREKRTGKMDEFVQTDLPKGVADSGQVAPADYAMKYRAGIPPPRSRGPKRLSEYQMQFQWKKGIASSPLLAAEQIIYNSNTQLAPYSKPINAPKMTEYNAAFKKWNYIPVAERKDDDQTPTKKAKMYRSKSLEAVSQPVKQHSKVKKQKQPEMDASLTPDKLRAAGALTAVRSDEDKRLLKESSNPSKIFFPHGKTKNVASEYASNFSAPAKFAYEGGVWRGADPPHIQPQKNPEPRAAEAQDADSALAAKPSWYTEVLELRKKADEYKQRARGTHFSREHLAQLYAQQADLWDTVSSSSTLSALSLESAGALTKKKRSPVSSGTPTEDSEPVERPQPVARKLAWDGDKKGQARPSSPSSKSRSTSTASLAGSDVASVSTLVESEDTEKGRIPTPQFRTKGEPPHGHRHHLDRTTPAVGGALLTSPARQKGTHIAQSDSAINRTSYNGPKVRCTCDADQSDTDSNSLAEGTPCQPAHAHNSPTAHPQPSQGAKNGTKHFQPPLQQPDSEIIQPIRTHTTEPVFSFLPERFAPRIKRMAYPVFTSTRRPVMVPQVAARLVGGIRGAQAIEDYLEGPEGYVNPVYLGEGEIMQPSAQALVTQKDTQYQLLPRPEIRPVNDPENTEDVEPHPVPKLKPALKGGHALPANRAQVSASWAGPSPTFGLPTRDTHVLVDEEASTDRPLPTKFTRSPSAKQQRHPAVNILPTLRETLRELGSSTEAAPDDDVLSMSARSVASSCSLASEVLERARNRRDEFWGKTKVKKVGRA